MKARMCCLRWRLTGLLTVLALETGGIQSFAAVWLIVVPLEAALSASRRVVALASIFALAAAGLLLVLARPRAARARTGRAEFGALAALGIISATLYATGLALGAEALARTSFWLLHAEEDRYRLLARNIDRRDHPAQPQWRSAVRVAGSRTAVRHASARAARPRPVRSRCCRRPAGLSHGAGGCSGTRGGAARSNSACAATVRHRPSIAASSSSGWKCAAGPLDRAAERRGAMTGELVAVMRDVTERKQQEQALEDARADAERANVAKSRFLATMSHELRTPLNVIIGFSEMLVKEDTMMIDPAAPAGLRPLINNSGHHLLSVVNGILDMSKIETGDFPDHTGTVRTGAGHRPLLRTAGA